MRKKSVLVSLAAVALMLSSCATSYKKSISESMVPGELERYADQVLSPEERALFSVPYKISPELAAQARKADRPGISRETISRDLVRLLLAEDQLGISYSHNCNYTAEQVYEKREANCISYTNLFIGMARAVGIDARYAEVTEVDSFTKVGDKVVYNNHICAIVFDGPSAFLVDFTLRDHPQYRSWGSISDLEATAIFYNNVGAQHHLDENAPGNLEEAERYYRMAAKLYPQIPQLHNNIGVLELNKGNASAAERHFREALEIRPAYFAAYANLGAVLLRRGDFKNAVSLFKAAVDASPDNIYAYQTLARLQASSGDLDAAEKTLRTVLKIDENFTEARHELGRVLLRRGRPTEALEQFAIAVALKPDDTVARNKMALIESLTVNK